MRKCFFFGEAGFVFEEYSVQCCRIDNLGNQFSAELLGVIFVTILKMAHKNVRLL